MRCTDAQSIYLVDEITRERLVHDGNKFCADQYCSCDMIYSGLLDCLNIILEI